MKMLMISDALFFKQLNHHKTAEESSSSPCVFLHTGTVVQFVHNEPLHGHSMEKMATISPCDVLHTGTVVQFVHNEPLPDNSTAKEW